MNSKYKNLIIAAMAAGIFYTNILEGMPKEKILVGVIFIFLGIVAVMELYDGIDQLRYETKKYLSKHRFNKYKSSLSGVIEKQRAKGKDEVYMKNLVTNFITHDKRYAFSGKQIAELLSLAADPERSA